MVPKYPFQVIAAYRVGPTIKRETKNFETLPAAMAYRDKVFAKPQLSSVQVLSVLDDTVRGYPE